MHLRSGLERAACSTIPGHTHSSTGLEHSRAGAGRLSSNCLFHDVHFSTWCPDRRLQAMKLHLFSPLNIGAVGIAGRLGYPSSWNAPPSRLLAAKQGTSRRRVQGDGPIERGFARRLLCWAGAMSPWTPGSEKIVQRQQDLIWNSNEQRGCRWRSGV